MIFLFPMYEYKHFFYLQVIQRRTSKDIDFYRTWKEYEEFFGNIEGNYWIGLKNIHQLTKDGNSELYVRLERHNGEVKYASYLPFQVKSGEDLYQLKVSDYSGTAGNYVLIFVSQIYT